MNTSDYWLPPLDVETIDAMEPILRRNVLGELASKIGKGGVEEISNHYHVNPIHIQKWKNDYERKIKKKKHVNTI